jgi:hypothetical protein
VLSSLRFENFGSQDLAGAPARFGSKAKPGRACGLPTKLRSHDSEEPTMHMAYLAQLARESLPVTVDDPAKIAMLRSLDRAGHLQARFYSADDTQLATVDTVTPLGFKVISCFRHRPSPRLTTAFWAFRVREAETPGSAAAL